MRWPELFERAATVETDEAAIGSALATRREARSAGDGDEDGDGVGDGEGEPGRGDREGNRRTDDEPIQDAAARQGDAAAGSHGEDTPPDETVGAAIARVVADADVLAADLLVGGPSRDALDIVRGHSWVGLVASDVLLSDAEAVIDELADEALASDWRDRIGTRVDVVDHPAGDHPAIAAAYHGDARHVLTLDETLASAATGVAVRGRVETSVKFPAAFARVFDPASLHPLVVGGPYPGPDCGSLD